MVVEPPLAFWDGPISAAANVARDEELLREGVTAVRVAVLNDRSVSVGVAQRPPDAVFDHARSMGLPVVVRRSGGTGLLHLPGDLVWSVVLPRDHPLVGDDFTCAYPRLGQGVVDALASRRIPATWTGPLSLSDRFCLLGSRGNVLTVEGRALGGAAQHLTRTALLHQGIVAGTVDRPALVRLFELPGSTLHTRVTALSELGVSLPTDPLGMRVLEDLERTVRAVR